MLGRDVIASGGDGDMATRSHGLRKRRGVVVGRSVKTGKEQEILNINPKL
jgi:hypothetical protein